MKKLFFTILIEKNAKTKDRVHTFGRGQKVMHRNKRFNVLFIYGGGGVNYEEIKMLLMIWETVGKTNF